MTAPDTPNAPAPDPFTLESPARGAALVRALLKLARPKQWAKSAFVLVGPAYGIGILLGRGLSHVEIFLPTLCALAAFCLAASGCYAVNDLIDREADRLHPRKRRRPIASGKVTPGVARVFASVLFSLAAVFVMLIPGEGRLWVGAAVGLYVANVFAYAFYFKEKVVADVVSLSIGFVLRVLGGCAAVMIEPSIWLLNVTLFLSMFLAFGKRLGERRTFEAGAAGTTAAAHRAVQGLYTDHLLRMAVVVSAVATLLTYSGYLQDQLGGKDALGTVQWLTILPATYALLRCIVLLESGRFDDPTELAFKDRGFLFAGALFAVITGVYMLFISGGVS